MSFTSKQTSEQQQKSTATPVEMPEYTGLRDQLIKMAMDKLTAPVPIAGYEATGVGNINKAYDLTRQTRENALTSRGLADSPIAGNADIMSENARAGEVANFQNQLPLLQRDLANQDWTQALQLFTSRPMGQTSTGTASGTTTTSTPVMQSVIPSIASMVGFMYGQGLFNPKSGAAGGKTYKI
jgi:hypothetical protein